MVAEANGSGKTRPGGASPSRPWLPENGNYTTLANSVLDNPAVSPMAKYAYVRIARRVNDSGICWVGQKRLGEELGRPGKPRRRRYVYGLIRELVSVEALEVLSKTEALDYLSPETCATLGRFPSRLNFYRLLPPKESQGTPSKESQGTYKQDPVEQVIRAGAESAERELQDLSQHPLTPTSSSPLAEQEMVANGSVGTPLESEVGALGVRHTPLPSPLGEQDEVVPVQEAGDGPLSPGVRSRLLRLADDDPRSLLSGDLHQLRTTLRDDAERGGEPCSLHFETGCLKCVELGQRLHVELNARLRIPT